jgi:hypothetical protein
MSRSGTDRSSCGKAADICQTGTGCSPNAYRAFAAANISYDNSTS